MFEKISINPDKPLKFEFPDIEYFFNSRDEYVKIHFQEQYDEVKKCYPTDSDEVIKYATIALLRAFHAVEQIFLAIPVYLRSGFFHFEICTYQVDRVLALCWFNLLNTQNQEVKLKDVSDLDDVAVSKVSLAINSNELIRIIKDFASKSRKKSLIKDFFRSSSDQISFDVEALELVYQATEISFIHELGHALGFAHMNVNKARILREKNEEIERDSILFLSNSSIEVDDSSLNQYMNLPSERRARIWEKRFKSKYYPNNQYF